jgi:toxin ParE1/3/4
MDLTDVLQYTLETWGDVQMRAYAAVLDKALLNLQTNPQIGHPRPEISAEHKIFPAGRHIIVYRVTDTAIYVSRVLHERMDIRRHVD